MCCFFLYFIIVYINHKKHRNYKGGFFIELSHYDFFNKKSSVLSVLGGVLGGGMSSRLFQKLREEMGVAYYVNAYNDASLDHGVFKISAGVSNDRVQEVITEILKECKRLTEELVSEKELAKVKSLIIGNTKLSFEATDDIANYYGRQELLKNKLDTIEQKATEVHAVTAKDIQKLAKLLFTNEGLTLAVIGPFMDKTPFQKLLKF